MDAFEVPEEFERARIKLVVLPRLVYGRGVSRLFNIVAFARVLRGARSLSIVGADVMDGGYGRRPSVLEWSLASAAAKAGIQTRVLGFSWKNDVDRQVQVAARRATRSGVVAFARDPHSRARLQANGVKVEEAADVVFLHSGTSKPNVHDERLQGWIEAGKRVAILNMSGLIQATFDQTEEYGLIVEVLRGLGYEILLLPHVSTDISVIEAFRSSGPTYSNIDYVERLLTPTEVKALVAKADVVVTGRMHLSILGLSMGVPSIVLATQGKVLGLMELVGTPRFCVDPVTGFANIVEIRLRELEISRTETVAMINSGVHEARVLAAVNFRDL
ncbi:polysaccharide pyruvyl transferase family protein [Cryobacterium sp. CG_9.6]|uniref:polysaccharide pyruvyl transferase family protein n=1 Tax=Cryobacterium sp. CG_9.6 TaxID=2760710 RepID=UPI00247B32F3|nr:polysaccharide pyruvyl transferase WcaK-like protein [Cryobacterium sp. CG_9.6]